IWPMLGRFLAAPLALLTSFLLRTVGWFAALPHWSYRIPTPPLWLTILFFTLSIAIAVVARLDLAPAKTRRLTVRTLSAGLIATAVLIATFPFPPTHAAGQLEST